MSKPLLLVFCLMVLIIVTQFEWKQQFIGDMVPNPTDLQNQPQISKREEVIKEKIILSQEKNINKLNELVKSLKEQLQQCKCKNETVLNEPPSSSAENVTEAYQDLILD